MESSTRKKSASCGECEEEDESLKVSKVFQNILSTIGHTPLIRLNVIPKKFGIECEMLVKCEFFNPGGSVKDRISLRMVEAAEESGKIKPGFTIIEPTSGNTGIGLAMVSVVKGYKCIIVLPETMSDEKVSILKALGAKVIRTPIGIPIDSPESIHEVAKRLNKEIPNSIVLNQFENPENPLTHYHFTAEEILDASDNQVDMVVAGAGTGGTITGIGQKMREKCPDCKIIGVLPCESLIPGYETASEDKKDEDPSDQEVEGIGFEFIPKVHDNSVVDKWIIVNDKDTFRTARMLIKNEGILCGGSSGAALYCAIQEAKQLKKGQKCVVILPDGERNYMTKFISDSWMSERAFFSAGTERSVRIWWWDKKISCMNLNIPVTISLDKTCKDALDIMHERGYEQLPVVNDSGLIKGIITQKLIRGKVMDGKNMSTTSVNDVLHKIYHKVSQDATLGRLITILDIVHYVFVLRNQNQTTKEEADGDDKKLQSDNDVTELPFFLHEDEQGKSSTDRKSTGKKQHVVGIVTRIDLLNYIAEEEKNG